MAEDSHRHPQRVDIASADLLSEHLLKPFEYLIKCVCGQPPESRCRSFLVDGPKLV